MLAPRSVTDSVGARWGMSAGRPSSPVGLREAGATSSSSWCYPWCYWGVGAPSPTPERGMLEDWKHLNFLFY